MKSVAYLLTLVVVVVLLFLFAHSEYCRNLGDLETIFSRELLCHWDMLGAWTSQNL